MDEFKAKRCAIFGGSFDPVHHGHLAMARTAKEQFSLDRVIFMPCYVSPFKLGTVASGRQRETMLRLSIEDAGMDWAEVSGFELSRDKPSYSWETATHFHEIEPDTQWYWILGTDQWNVIDQWAEPERLRSLLHFIVFSRDGRSVIDRPGWRHEAVSFFHAASSTAIRDDFAAAREWMTPPAYSYCDSEEIYR